MGRYRGADDLTAENVADALVAEADAENRDSAGKAPEIPASRGVQGPGEIIICEGERSSISSRFKLSLR